MRKLRKAPADKVALGAPSSVNVTMEAPPPVDSPDLGIKVARPRQPASHPLVTIGDSLTQGFQSGAIFNTDLSWPTLVARSGGYYGNFKHPHYSKFGGLPLNIEYIQRALEDKYGVAISGLTLLEAAFFLRSELADICHYWQDGDGAIVPRHADINDNLATFGYDLRDAMSLKPDNILRTIAGSHENVLFPLASHGKERAALRTLPHYDRKDRKRRSMSALEAARVKGADGGIDTLIVMLGSNNALGVTTDLKLRWSQNRGFDKLGVKDAFNIWQPQHFAAEFGRLVKIIRGIAARRVIFATVTHVTIAPLLHGIGQKVVHPDGKISRYFAYYSRPWFDKTFDPNTDPHLTENDARTIDSTIDQYNDTIVSTVRAARTGGLDWYIFDLRTLLDRLAYRRYAEGPASPPAWWTPYELPPPLKALEPVLDTQFFFSGPAGRTQGGIIALDGIHPTTIGYGLIAQEAIDVMTAAGVTGLEPIDFTWLLAQDSLLSSPPAAFDETFSAVRWLDERFEYVRRVFGPRRHGR